MTLDSFQQKAAFQNHHYTLIIAGAGTGKTHTLLGRIKYLISEQHLKPEEILVISYTNETVKDFSNKAQNILGISLSVCTFHKLALTILKQNELFFSNHITDSLDFIVKEFFYSYIFYSPFLQYITVKIISPFNFIFQNTYRKFLENGKFLKLQRELIQYIHMCSAKGDTLENISYLYEKSTKRKKYFLLLVFLLWNLYQSEKESQNEFDFDDLIREASNQTDLITTFPYKHVLIDEFQDSSFMRISFFKKLVDRFSLDFTVVGDDCQSIYGFSGTAANCFSILSEFFPLIKTYYLKYTYRNSQELIDIANDFVLKNPLLLQKSIYSHKHLEFPIVVLYYKQVSAIKKMIEFIFKNGAKEVLFLGRNSFDLKYYFHPSDISWIDEKHFTYKYFPKQIFTFLTVHKAKGLEADTVVVLHMENSVYGFPNKIPVSPYCQFTPSYEMAFSEERRIFYVALTRTKSKIYLLTPLFNPSIFIIELQKNYRKKIKSMYF